jgi:DNA-binding transcriptional MerR regulator
MNVADRVLWTLEELVERGVAELGGTGYAGVSSGRVRDVPDLRTIRYYTTLGLVDRPVAVRNRKGLYGRRQLLQLVAIKRLQARGMSLAAIQECLLGLTDAALRQLVDAQQAAPSRGEASRVGMLSTESRAGAFWKTPATMFAAHTAPSAVLNDEAATEPIAAVLAVHLGDDMVLSLAPRRALEQEDLRLIRTAAAPLIEMLKLRGLIEVGPLQP